MAAGVETIVRDQNMRKPAGQRPPPSPHVVCLPFFLPGHVEPMMQLARWLARRGVVTTVVHTHHNYKQFMIQSRRHHYYNSCRSKVHKKLTVPDDADHQPFIIKEEEEAAAGTTVKGAAYIEDQADEEELEEVLEQEDIIHDHGRKFLRFESIPDGLPPHLRSVIHAGEQLLASDSHVFVTAFDSLMDKLMLASSTTTSSSSSANSDQLYEDDDDDEHINVLPPPPCFLISDAILSWTSLSASRLSIPRAALWTNCLSSWPAFDSIPLLFSNNCHSINDRDSYPLDFLPGLPPIYHFSDLPTVLQIPDINHPLLQFIMKQMHLCKKADLLLCNTSAEIEGDVITALSAMTQGMPRVLPIGPLVAIMSNCLNKKQNPIQVNPSCLISSEEGDQDIKCMSWLQSQAPCSVLYVSFGSLVYLPEEQVTGLAMGLEAAGVPVLWVVRPDFIEGNGRQPYGALLEGMVSKEKALVVPWAPQVQVLKHPSVGGFLTHCGWNSILESLSAGIPMLGWPIASEQMMNCKMVVQKWKVGWEIKWQKESQSKKFSCNELGLDITKSSINFVSLMIKEEVKRVVRLLMESQDGERARERARELSQAISIQTSSGQSHSLTNLESLLAFICHQAAM